MSFPAQSTQTAYIANTSADQAKMLDAIGAGSVADLFAALPPAIRDPKLSLPAALGEAEVTRLLRDLADRNWDPSRRPCFLGAGVYRHFIPSVVGYVTGRAEFLTSYTPYQPEVSQGNLQAIYEYQSLVCLLTGMDVANASMYDGATASAEAAVMAVNVTGRDRVVVAPWVHPETVSVLHTYLVGQGIEVAPLDFNKGASGALDATTLATSLDERTACVIVQQPNFLGSIEDLAAIASASHAVGALLVVCVDPFALGLLEAPGDLGADVVVGEGQPLGLPANYGGPYLGIFACREAYVRQMPGRIVGATVDTNGNRGFVLTYQTREQHIRREKATSNICSNESLCALAATVYLSWMGPTGLREVAETCLQRAHYAAREIARLPGYSLAYSAPFFDEFVVDCPLPAAEINRLLLDRGIIGGYDLGRLDPALADRLLLCVTETNERSEIDALVAALGEIGATHPSEPIERPGWDATRKLV